MTMTRYGHFWLVASATLVCTLLLSACGDDGETNASPTAAGPSATPVPTQAANEAAIAVAEAYLTSDGVDGEKGEFTDPLNCSAATDESPGRFCIHDTFSTYAPGLVILRFGDKEDPEETVWEIRLVPDEQGWQVTSAKPFELTE